jgi:hypothetical protein
MKIAADSALPLELLPYPGQPAPAGLRLTAAAGWLELGADAGHGAERGLGLRWRLEGDLSAVQLPEATAAPERRDGLWEHSCFEAFLAASGEPAYVELNLSPAGHWNLYQLDAYRSGLRPDLAVTALPSRRRQGPGWLELALELPVACLPAGAAGLELAITAVLQQPGGVCSYWALAHAGPEPDFHRRESFVHSL